MPKVSICIPTYNQPQLLRKALSSIAIQTFQNFEIIISDDTPDDCVKEILNDFNFNNKLHYFHHLKPLGAPANWNFAMQHAKGNYIKILHHDDYFTSNLSLQKYVNLLDENPNCNFAFSGTEIELIAFNLKNNHVCSNKEFKYLKKQSSLLFFNNVIGAPSATIIRNNKLFFNENYKWLVDVEWYINLINNNEIAFTTELLICTVHGSSQQVTQQVINDSNIQVKEHVLLFTQLYNQKINIKKANLLFQILFNKFNINSINSLENTVNIPTHLRFFFIDVLNRKNNFKFLKKVFYWLNKYTFNDIIFTLKKIGK